MHRRISLGVCMLLLLLFLAGAASAAEPPAAPEASAIKSFDLLDWVWEWLSSVVGDEGISNSGGGHLSGLDYGPFMDPNGND